MTRIKGINRIYLYTVLVWLLGGMLNTILYSKTNNATISLILSQVILVIPTIYYVISNRMKFGEVGRFNKLKISTTILVLIFAYTIMPLMSLINMISMLFVKNEIQNTIEQIVNEQPIQIGILVVAVIPSIFEELVYRGIFFYEYRKANVLKGILLSALLFALLHMNFNQFFYAFIMGMIFALIIEVTDSILASMLIHFVINGSSTLLTYMLPKLQAMLVRLDPSYVADISQGMNVEMTRTELLVMISTYAPMAFVFTVLAAWVFVLIGKNTGRLMHIKSIFLEDRENDGMAEDELFSWSLIGAIIICVVIMLVNEL